MHGKACNSNISWLGTTDYNYRMGQISSAIGLEFGICRKAVDALWMMGLLSKWHQWSILRWARFLQLNPLALNSSVFGFIGKRMMLLDVLLLHVCTNTVVTTWLFWWKTYLERNHEYIYISSLRLTSAVKCKSFSVLVTLLYFSTDVPVVFHALDMKMNVICTPNVYLK